MSTSRKKLNRLRELYDYSEIKKSIEHEVDPKNPDDVINFMMYVQRRTARTREILGITDKT